MDFRHRKPKRFHVIARPKAVAIPYLFLPPSKREVPRRGGGSVVKWLGHSPSQKSKIFASPLWEGVKYGFSIS